MNTGAHEFFELALDLTTTPRKIVKAVGDAFDQGGEQAVKEWRKNAQSTAGKHARLYPYYISHEKRFTLGGNVEVEVGPRRVRQGNLGRILELGSKNNPPHLDGLKAFDVVEPRLEKLTDAVIRGIIP